MGSEQRNIRVPQRATAAAWLPHAALIPGTSLRVALTTHPSKPLDPNPKKEKS